MNFANFVSVCSQIVVGFKWTLVIFFVTLLFSMPLGLLVARCRMSKVGFIKRLTQVIISILRGTPLMLQLIVVFYGPYFVLGMRLSSSWRMFAVMIGFSINYSAYFGEIFRAGFEAVPPGQLEAARVLGYSRIQTYWKITFPQMVKRVIPPVTNEVITLTKDTSLAFALAFTEMFTLAKQIAAAQSNIAPLFVAGLFYYIFNFVVAWIMERIEKKLSYYN